MPRDGADDTFATNADESLFSPVEQGFLKALGLSKPAIAAAAIRAEANNTTIERELLTSGGVEEDAYYGAFARYLGLPFLERIEAGQVVDLAGLDELLRRHKALRLSDGYRAPLVAVVPEAGRVEQLRDNLAAMPSLYRGLVVTTPSVMRRAVWEAGAERRVRAVTSQLFDSRPHLSARIVLTGAQGFVLGVAISCVLAALVFDMSTTLLCLHMVLSSFYLGALILRCTAIVYGAFGPRRAVVPIDAGDLPIYTVMVALYREGAVVGQLLKALDRLDWPRSLLDIKFVCEADDRETINAIRALRPGPHYEIVEVPACGPRTKPKALSYALTGIRGDFVVVYDAEDRPHPGQLREAYQRFVQGPDNLVCLQAPLIVSNADKSWISALFAIEYAGLFRGLIPALARGDLPVPLGGTSNHFRAEVLRQVGGWDPHNVTEDADLGMRLFRLGYRVGVLRCQTLEDAPVDAAIWMRQRTRWFKGWLQTWLVIMRDGGAARRDMGTWAYLVFHLLIGGMLLSALLHPAMLVFVGVAVAAMLDMPRQSPDILRAVLLVIDMINVFGAYACFVVLGGTAMIAHEKRLIGYRWLGIPVYWLMMTVAAWKALYELKTRPFFWHKTPHAPVAAKETAASPDLSATPPHGSQQAHETQ